MSSTVPLSSAYPVTRRLSLRWRLGAACRCRRPVTFHRRAGAVLCVRCRGEVGERS